MAQRAFLNYRPKTWKLKHRNRGFSSKNGSLSLLGVVAREVAILSGIAGVIGSSLCMTGYVTNLALEYLDLKSGPFPIGKHVILGDGRKIHVNDQNNGVGNSFTIVFESAQGETLLEFEQVASRLLELAPKGTRCITYSRSGLGISEPPTHPSFMSLMYSALRSTTYSSSTLSETRSSSVIAMDLSHLLKALNVTGPIISVSSGIGALHSRSLLGQLDHTAGISCEGLVMVEPITEGTAAEHAEINPGLSHQQRLYHSFWNAFGSQVGFLRLAALISGTALKRAAGLYGSDSFGGAVLKYCARRSHAYTALAELEAWDRCETDAAETGCTSSALVPVLILTRGRPRALFQEMEEVDQLERAWDKGLLRLKQTLASGGFDVCVATVEDGGLRLPLYRPDAVAVAINTVITTSLERASTTPPLLSRVVALLPPFKDADSMKGRSSLHTKPFIDLNSLSK